jgi:GNAT superfamily N-acetyltransferase
MTHYRPLAWPQDRDRLTRLDVSFDTDAIFTVTTSQLGFTLAELPVDPPLHKQYPIAWDTLPAATLALVAENDAQLLGVAALQFHEWNRSALITDLYVDRPARRHGVASGLLGELRSKAWNLGARCLRLETQTVNIPAIRFYTAQGFTCCGLDIALYDPREQPDEAALFFTLTL